MGDISELVPQEFSKRIAAHRFRNHMTGMEIRQRVPPSVRNSYFKFCVERNPWEKVVSQYYMYRARHNPLMSFEEFVRTGYIPVDANKWFDRTTGTYLVDRILQYSMLDKNLREVFHKLGIPFSNGLTTKEKTEYRKIKNPMRTYYSSQALIDKVANLYELEISIFGYRFPED